MSTWVVEVMGLSASVVSVVLWWPQAVRTWRLRADAEALAGISIGTQLLLACNALLWAGYGLATGAFWVAAPGLINLPLAVWTTWLVDRSARRRRLASGALATDR